MNLKEHLGDHILSPTILALAEAVKGISQAVKTADMGKVGTMNSSGEEQIAIDVQADEILRKMAEACDQVGLLASEEMEGEDKVGEGEYAICHDPLDGSSLFDVNLSVGTIVGIYKTNSFIGVKGDDQVGAFVAVYGPRTTIFFTLRDGVNEFTLIDSEFVMTKENIKVAEEGKMFAPGNLRACSERKDYLKLVNYWCENQYRLRYSGGMVPDINHILIKGMGVFAYPGYGDQPNGKLRLLYECAPMALLMEEAGGSASDGQNRVLEIVVKDLHQRTPIFVGSKMEVQRCKDFLAGIL
ncbi:fructose-1,6-bisphosphatase [Candidatus Gracilibacteria bacterium]|nr:fructose-1,6-bisphosphatase [Candidatus Gracilibacteria bacterium]